MYRTLDPDKIMPAAAQAISEGVAASSHAAAFAEVHLP